ncbi:matrix metalloproteinase-20-like [Hemiscyllium ocellatum]|uniref:matrix metalloproteinase-20-like n=1 Tax=Hemiscyllium ocellatum TaxID=170820 RepID=UPI002966464D|nr:matrix metalloproteinase-20-like [Hemiscyllium ocellatum]
MHRFVILNNPSQIVEMLKYIKQFYTFGDGSENLIESKGSLSGKIKELQQFYGLQETGELNRETIEIMKAPRCGFPDLARYQLYPGRPRWRKPFVTYNIVNYLPQLSYFEIEDAIWRAVNIWQKATPLNFVRVHNFEADIMISFEGRAHGDNFPFDGRGGTLAHAFSPGPGIGGNIHFDQDEDWTIGHYGVNLFHVAAHEFGHALGLGHSRHRSAVMYPTYKYGRSNIISLSWDDIIAVQDLYFWRIEPKVADAKFIAIQDVWHGLPSSIDAACEIPEDNIIYFFKGSKFWTYSHFGRSQNSSQSISLFGFPTYVKQIDAVVFIQQTKKLIFFVGTMYWSYNDETKSMDDGYPKQINSSWPGIDDNIDAALQNNGLLYFFSGSRLYEYDNWRREIVPTNIT